MGVRCARSKLSVSCTSLRMDFCLLVPVTSHYFGIDFCELIHSCPCPHRNVSRNLFSPTPRHNCPNKNYNFCFYLHISLCIVISQTMLNGSKRCITGLTINPTNWYCTTSSQMLFCGSEKPEHFYILKVVWNLILVSLESNIATDMLIVFSFIILIQTGC